MIREKKFFVVLLAIMIVTAAPLLAAPQKGFPPEGGVEYEHSIITIPITLAGDSAPTEVIKFDAFMRLVREVPARNGLGFRQFEFFIDSWDLYGYSKALNANITFKLSSTVHPKSLGVALQKGKDYPAMIVYNAIYDVFLNDVKIAENRPGVAFATGVMEIPPRNITVAFEKPFSLADARAKDTSGALKVLFDTATPPTDFTLSSGTCEDMRSITPDEYSTGVSMAEQYRAGKGLAKLHNKKGDSTAAGAKKHGGSSN
jgi:hypothetical protein